MESNPSKAGRGWPPVVVASAFQTGVVLMRNLRRRGLEVCCIDNHRDNPGFRTVYGRAFECPNPEQQPAQWRDFMVELAHKFDRKPVLIPSSDLFVSAMAAHAEDLAAHFVFCNEGIERQGMLATKERQYELAEAHGMPVPRTRYVQTLAEVGEFAESACFPCILKPLHFRDWEGLPIGHPLRYQKLAVADSRDALLDAYRSVSDATPRLVAQEIIEGPDTAKSVYLSCYGRDGARIGSCVLREVRTYPIHFGSASVVEPAVDEEVDATCDRFLRQFGYAGLCEIELKRDARAGRVQMIEANPRYTVTSDAAPYAGVDLGWIHYLDLIGEKVHPVSAGSRPFRHVVLLRDIPTIGAYRRAGLETWGSVLRSYRPPIAFFDLDWRDWRVSARNLKAMARAVIGPLWRKIRPRKRANG